MQSAPHGRARLLGDRFELVAELGTGSMGEVYRARDRARGQDIALKVLPALDATALLRFKNEFRALHDVQHPNLVRLHELHEDRGTWFFTMQLVNGVDVLTWIGDDEERLRHVLPQIAQALDRLHADGLVHRDVKPSNIRVTPQGTAMLFDFGLIAPTWSCGEGAGTPAYMAPEQIRGDVTEAADWYAFGVLLFRALTGRLPFIGSADEVMNAKQRQSAPRVRDLAPRAPQDLATLADALLARAPQERPSGAAVRATLGAGSEPTHVAQTIVVGRDRELAELHRAVTDRMAGQPLVIQVNGDSGIGKTTLLRAFAEELEQSGDTWVLVGRCWERESVHYKGFDGVIDELAARLAAEDIDLPDAGWSAILAQAFPALRAVRGFAAPPAELGGYESTARLSAALRWLFGEVAARQPLVIILYDLHWADRDTLAVLRAIVDPPLQNVLIAFGARDHVEIRSQCPIRSLDLAPLSQADAATLVELTARELGRDVDAAAIAREAGGHPLFASKLVRHAVATGELASLSLERVVVELAEHLGADAKRIATIINLSHAALSLEAAADAAGHADAAFFDAVAALRGAQLVATSGAGNDIRLKPYHDRIRRVLTEHLAPHELVELHGRIARALEATGSQDHAALAEHWAEAGERAAAARHARSAAQQAEAALAYHRAAHWYRRLLALDPTATDARVRLAESLAQAGLGVDAADAFLACARDASGADAIDLRRRAMQQLLIMGHNERASQLLDELMRWLDLPNPTKRRRLLLALLAKRASLRLRKLALPGETARDVSPLERERADILWDASTGFAMLDPPRAFYFHTLNLEMCFRIGDRARIARAMMGEATFLGSGGKRTKRLDSILRVAEEPAMNAAFPPLRALARGTTAFFFGHWRECREQLEQCEELLHQDRPRLVREGFGPAHLQDLTRRLMLTATLYLGDLRTLRRRIPALLADAIERNDVSSSTHLRGGVQTMFYLACNEIDAASEHAEEAFRPWRASSVGIPHFMYAQSRAALEIYQGRGDGAYRHLTEMWPSFVEARIFRAQYVHITMLDARARAAVAAAHLADAERCARKLLELRAVWSVPLAHAVRGAIAIARGNAANARMHLENAAVAFAAADMRLYEANARFVHAQLAGDHAAAATQRRVLSDAGIVDVERYSRLLLPRA